MKQHDDHRMAIVWSMQLESSILTKLTKPSVRVILVGPQVSLPLWWVPASRGSVHFLCVITRHFLACEDIAGGSDLSTGEHFFREIQRPFRWVPAVRWRNKFFTRNKVALPCYGRGSSCQPLHVQYSSDGSHSLTTLTTPHREHQDGGRWRGLGRGQCGAGEDAIVDAHA